MADDLGDRTEAPTANRRAEARRDGKLVVSAELSASLMCLAALILLQQTGGKVVAAMKVLLIEGLKPSTVSPDFGRIVLTVGSVLAPIVIGLILIGLAANLAQTRFWFGWRRKTGALDPIAGTKQIFSVRSAVRLFLNLVKLAIVLVVGFATVRGRLATIVSLENRSVGEMLATGMGLVFAVAIRVTVALVALSLIDYAFQKFSHERELRMTKRELKDELRRQEGDPEIKRRRRALADVRDVSRIKRDVAGADVVVVDEAFEAAAALKYDPGTMSSPRVLACGSGLVAARWIHEAAIEHGVSIVERSKLAIEIARVGSRGRDLPDHLHAEVAEILAFAYAI